MHYTKHLAYITQLTFTIQGWYYYFFFNGRMYDFLGNTYMRYDRICVFCLLTYSKLRDYF